MKEDKYLELLKKKQKRKNQKKVSLKKYTLKKKKEK